MGNTERMMMIARLPLPSYHDDDSDDDDDEMLMITIVVIGIGMIVAILLADGAVGAPACLVCSTMWAITRRATRTPILTCGTS
jgi:hypothetical protein